MLLRSWAAGLRSRREQTSAVHKAARSFSMSCGERTSISPDTSTRERAMTTTPASGGLNFELPEDLKLLKRSIREFVEKELWPLTGHLEERDEIPQAVLDAMKAMGLFGLPFPEEY